MRGRRRNSQAIRIEIANAAARMLIEGLADDFASAKRKAAEQFGADDQRQLPDNREVHAAIVEQQQIFEGEEVRARTAHMRREALSAMRFCAQFSPCLVGPVLYGTPFAHSPVTLHLFSDEVERFSRFLHDNRISYRLDSKQLRLQARVVEEVAVFEVWQGDLEFEFVVMPEIRWAHAPLSPLDGKPYQRLTLRDLEALRDRGLEGELYFGNDSQRRSDWR